MYFAPILNIYNIHIGAECRANSWTDPVLDQLQTRDKYIKPGAGPDLGKEADLRQYWPVVPKNNGPSLFCGSG